MWKMRVRLLCTYVSDMVISDMVYVPNMLLL